MASWIALLVVRGVQELPPNVQRPIIDGVKAYLKGDPAGLVKSLKQLGLGDALSEGPPEEVLSRIGNGGFKFFHAREAKKRSRRRRSRR